MRRERKKEESVSQKIASAFWIASCRAFANNNIEGSRCALDGLQLQSVLNSNQEKEKKDHCHSPGGRDSITISSLPESTKLLEYLG